LKITDIFASLKLLLKNITVHFFLLAGHITIGIVAQATNQTSDCNKLGTYYKFEQYEQQEKK